MKVFTEAPFSIKALVDEYVEALEEPRPPDGMWHPSSYWGCDRRAIYEVRGVEQTNPSDARARRIFRVGHLIHSFVQTALASAPDFVAFYPEFAIESKLEERGHGDGLVFLEDIDTGPVVVIEAKSKNSTGMRYIRMAASDDHAKQGSSYAVQARTTGVWIEDGEERRFIPALGERVVGVIVVYFDKDSLDIVEHWLPYETEWEQRVADRITHLNKYRDDPDSLPPRLPMSRSGGKLKKNWMCDWGTGRCPFLDRCYKQDGSGTLPAGERSEIPEVYEW